MANPTKNFTDPSGTPFRMSGWITVPSGFNTGNAIPVLTGQGRLIAIQPSSFDTRLFTTFRQAMHMDLTNKVWSKIPPPPMGRQILLTFPPIYKERGANSSRPTEGQEWPRFVVTMPQDATTPAATAWTSVAPVFSTQAVVPPPAPPASVVIPTLASITGGSLSVSATVSSTLDTTVQIMVDGGPPSAVNPAWTGGGFVMDLASLNLSIGAHTIQPILTEGTSKSAQTPVSFVVTSTGILPEPGVPVIQEVRQGTLLLSPPSSNGIFPRTVSWSDRPDITTGRSLDLLLTLGNLLPPQPTLLNGSTVMVYQDGSYVIGGAQVWVDGVLVSDAGIFSGDTTAAWSDPTANNSTFNLPAPANNEARWGASIPFRVGGMLDVPGNHTIQIKMQAQKYTGGTWAAVPDVVYATTVPVMDGGLGTNSANPIIVAPGAWDSSRVVPAGCAVVYQVPIVGITGDSTKGFKFRLRGTGDNLTADLFMTQGGVLTKVSSVWGDNDFYDGSLMDAQWIQPVSGLYTRLADGNYLVVATPTRKFLGTPLSDVSMDFRMSVVQVGQWQDSPIGVPAHGIYVTYGAQVGNLAIFADAIAADFVPTSQAGYDNITESTWLQTYPAVAWEVLVDDAVVSTSSSSALKVPIETRGLAPGFHTFKVRMTDQAGVQNWTWSRIFSVRYPRGTVQVPEELGITTFQNWLQPYSGKNWQDSSVFQGRLGDVLSKKIYCTASKMLNLLVTGRPDDSVFLVFKDGNGSVIQSTASLSSLGANAAAGANVSFTMPTGTTGIITVEAHVAGIGNTNFQPYQIPFSTVSIIGKLQ